MKKDKIFTYNDLKQFVLSQRDDRPIVMNVADDPYNCGCVLAHYARKIFKKQVTNVGFAMAVAGKTYLCASTDDYSKVFDYVSKLVYRRIENYGQAKRLLA